MKQILFITISLFFLATLSPAIHAQSETADASKKTIATEATSAETSVFIKVKGVGCVNDLQLIVDNVKKLDGVSECKVIKKGAVTSFKVNYNPGEAVEKDIHAAIEGTGCCHDPEARPYKVKL